MRRPIGSYLSPRSQSQRNVNCAWLRFVWVAMGSYEGTRVRMPLEALRPTQETFVYFGGAWADWCVSIVIAKYFLSTLLSTLRFGRVNNNLRRIAHDYVEKTMVSMSWFPFATGPLILSCKIDVSS